MFGVGVGVEVGVGVRVGTVMGLESCEVLGKVVGSESEATEACDLASVLGEEGLGGGTRTAVES